MLLEVFTLEPSVLGEVVLVFVALRECEASGVGHPRALEMQQH